MQKARRHNLRRTLYRYVDWNSTAEYRVYPSIAGQVVPYIGTWIETPQQGIAPLVGLSRTLYRYVDWNLPVSEVDTRLLLSYLI